MSVLKCKMCGGDLQVSEGMTVCECEYCGSKQTVSSINDEKIIKLYDRANRLRMASEFDKAAGVYESIIEESDVEAEAYWGLLLCKYGIEYVDDPATGNKIPTCHRSSFNNILEDPDFDLVMENADAISRTIYRESAKQIEELRKSIIEVSSKEEPYDIFICYKETADDGQRTIDSVIAQDVYDELTELGYRVFFSRVTLEDKLGQEYEPYIFAALNSAKVMLAFGTQYDYYNAVWVKNEWSRFLQLMEAGQKKTLIPCYKNIDAYDMPKEFAKLQAQDMGKVGAIQDLVRGIKKIIPKEEAPAFIGEAVASGSGGDSIMPLLDRAFIFLEDGKFSEADEYCERVLDQDPRNGKAYLGKLMAENGVRRQDELVDCEMAFDNSDNYMKAIRFGGEDLANSLRGYIIHINERNEHKRTSDIYDNAVNLMKDAGKMVDGETKYRSAAEKFKSIIGFKDAENLSGVCDNLAEESRKNTIYNMAIKQKNEDRIESVETAINSFRSIIGWKDADEQINICEKRIIEIKEREENDKRERELRERQEKKIAKKKLMYRIIVVGVLSIVVIVVVVVKLYDKNVRIPKQRYESAVALMQDSKYEEALNVFESISDYRDCSKEISECRSEIDRIKSKENAEKEEKRKKEIERNIEEGNLDAAISELADVKDEDFKQQTVDQLVDDLLKRYDRIKITTAGQVSPALIESIRNDSIKVCELANDEQRKTITEANDRKCILAALTYIGLYNDFMQECFDLVIDNERYKNDIDICYRISDLYREMAKLGIAGGPFRIGFDKTSHCFTIQFSEMNSNGKYESKKYYVISFDSSKMTLGREKDSPVLELYRDITINSVTDTSKKEPLTVFTDIL